MGNGNSLQVERAIDDLQAKVQGYTLKFLVYLLRIAGAEITLGAAWLATLGPHIVDYRALSFQFYHENQFITLHGGRDSGPQPASMHQPYPLCTTKAIAECYQVTATNSDELIMSNNNSLTTAPVEEHPLQFSSDMPDTLQQLILKYQKVFFVPTAFLLQGHMTIEFHCNQPQLRLR